MGYSNLLFPAYTRKVNFSGLCMEPFIYIYAGRNCKFRFDHAQTDQTVSFEVTGSTWSCEFISVISDTADRKQTKQQLYFIGEFFMTTVYIRTGSL